MKNSNNYIKLNMSEFLYYAMEDISPALTQLITLRFKTKHSPEKIREAFRYMLTIYPKLRSIIEPTLISYKIRIIDDRDPQTQVLIDDSFRVINKIQYNTEDYIQFRKDLLNHPFKLQQSLPIKIRFLPDASVIFISLHHTTCDGIGWLHMVESLISFLNDKKPLPTPLENPSMLNGLLKKPYFLAPVYILKSFLYMYKTFLLDRKNKEKIQGNNKIIDPSPNPVKFYGPSDVEQHFISHNLATLRAKSKELGCSLNVLFLAAMARGILKMNDKEKGDVVTIRLSYDLRPYFDGKPPLFGNYVTSSVLKVYRKHLDEPKVMMDNIQIQLKDSIDMLKNKNFIGPWMIGKMFTVVGKKIYSKGAILAKKKGLSVFQTTIHFSTIGNRDNLNEIGEKAQVHDAIATVPTFGLFLTLCNIDGIFNINMSYPTAEYTREQIKEIIASFEEDLGVLIKLN